MQKFKMLRFAAGIVEGTGWLCVVAGAFMLLVGFGKCNEAGKMSDLAGMLLYLVGLIPIVVGELLILCGQAGKCFIAIEENTRDVKRTIADLGAALRSPPTAGDPGEGEVPS